MARTESNMLPLGSSAPHFSLPDTLSGETQTLEQLKSEQATVIFFICNHCPFVIHVQEQLIQLAKDYQPKGISFIAISSNDVENYPDDSPEKMREVGTQLGYPFPYLYDETQEIAKAYQAACTPDFYIFDHNLKLAYRGQLDDSRPGNDIPVTGASLRTALECLLANKAIPSPQKPSLGCNIKWKEN
ncbi:thioredoxin family protein [Hazenella sp. IB182353]|uniref:thioredoxin family protein n=1 Tax=Polycladospora coralii TaxID=2771432 RepID=UPI00174756E2|nr:thioredoxin family protein [Polycladospora coralii]MBS7531689.1 thioredoxin family protein [Polycladospora coralii]